MISNLPIQPILIVAALTALLCSAMVDAAKTLVITSPGNNESETLVLPDDAQLEIDVTSEGIILTIPNVNIGVKCLGLASAPNTCTLTAGGGTLSADDDGDGVPNNNDNCEDTGGGELVDNTGCSINQKDDDSDGVPNATDNCANTPVGATVNAQGCSDAQSDPDSDGDGVPNSVDQCDDEAGPANNNGCPSTPPGGGSVDTSLYCNGANTSLVVCSKNSNLDDIYASEATVERVIPRGKILALPFTILNKSSESDVYGAVRMITDMPAYGFVPGQPQVKFWYSTTPGGSPMDTTGKCSKFAQQADGAFYWAQGSDPYACTLGSKSTTGVRYFNIAVACNTAYEECPTASQYSFSHIENYQAGDYVFEMTRDYGD